MSREAGGGRREAGGGRREEDPGRRVPEELDAAMRRALVGKASPTATEVLEAAERLLDQVLRTECENRSSALDLLTVDALMTRAMEIAAREPESIDAVAREAMHRIAAK